MNKCSISGFSTAVPYHNLWKPGWLAKVSLHSFSTAAAALLGSLMSVPGARVRVQVSVVAGMMGVARLTVERE